MSQKPKKNCKPARRRLAQTLLLLALVPLLGGGCATTKKEHGVTIEKERNFNPFDNLPFL